MLAQNKRGQRIQESLVSGGCYKYIVFRTKTVTFVTLKATQSALLVGEKRNTTLTHLFLALSPFVTLNVPMENVNCPMYASAKSDGKS